MKDLLQIVDIGYQLEIRTADNGKKGLEAVGSFPPDLIVSDIMMPEMDGYEFLTHVRQNPAWLHIPVIFLTAKGSRQDIHKGRISGADLYITKPFNSREFVELIQSQLQRTFQLRQMRQQAMNDLKRDILQILNHEFRTPLTYVTAYYEMLADGMNRLEDNQNFYDYLRGIQVGCVRLTRLVEDFIKVIEIRTGDMRTLFQAQAKPFTNLNELLHTSLQMYRLLAQEYGIELAFQPTADRVTLFGVPDGLVDAFNRLLDNALKFTHRHRKQGGRVELSTAVSDTEVAIAFRDQGMGFPAHVKEQLFQLFVQYNRTVYEQQGSGVGLTIAQTWVELHHGRIEVESQENVGSTFTILLPLYRPGQPPSLRPLHTATRSATLLLVEDDPHLLMGLHELLLISNNKYQMEVLTAQNGRIGLQVLATHPADLIVSDIMMPEMDGYEFLRQVRQNPKWLQIPFIFLTAKGERRDIHRGWSSGVEEYITKPYDSDQLLQLIEVQLDRHFQRQAVMAQGFDELKRSILNLITPDFRQPLFTVATYSESLLTNLQNAPTERDLKQSLHGIRDGSMRLEHLVEDLITLAELRTGEAATAYNLRAITVENIGVLLYDAVQSHLLYARSTGIELICTLTPELRPVRADEHMLQTCLQHLVEMGMECCHHQAACNEIRLQSHIMGDEVGLSMVFAALIDDGRQRALLMGQQEESRDLLQYASISIIRGVMDLHNGRILLQTDSHTTTITLLFPACPTNAPFPHLIPD